ncbi:MAG: deoxyhypusine synthase family protein [Candidatus Omnitrophica bacterium]|nr:deoxyhypusine synthase family protein [Candidatus Omnitrophota bacterium]
MRRRSRKCVRGLIPTKAIDLSKAHSVGDIVRQMSSSSFGARSVGEAADILYEMARDKDCFVVLTVSGAMTVAKMGLILCDMIDNGLVNAVVSTGAVITHGFIEATGKIHFKADPNVADEELYRAGYDRVYDTLESERNFDDIALVIEGVLNGIDRGKTLSSVFINETLGKHLSDNVKGRNILKSAYLKGVPVYVPAFTDSELGLDVGVFNRRARARGERPFSFDPFLDLEHFTEIIAGQKRLGIFTVGGGVPRNWAQQVCPYLDIISNRLKAGMPVKKYLYGVRICHEPAHLGGLSGCTYQEGISWGKFTPASDGGRWSEVYADATIAWPLIVKAVLERMKRG